MMLSFCLSICLSVRLSVDRLFFPSAVWGSAGGGFSYRLRYTCFDIARLSKLTGTGTGNDVVAIARCVTDNVEVNRALAGGQPHQALAGVGSTVTGTDLFARRWRTVLRTHTATVLAPRTVPARDPRTRIYTIDKRILKNF